ncbi:MAG TPA: FeoA family protein [bacterium]|nr:FeoA family protein [bacterium]HOM26599.1 FeoA family protein [bacterium]
MKKLVEAKEGKYKVVDVLKHGKLKKLCNMGIFVGDIIEVVKPAPGPVIIKKGNITIGIGCGIAMDIIVEKVE